MADERKYHRENLRQDLLLVGRAFIAANGHQGLSVRGLAQHVGVSPGAPYHHFPDRRALLVGLALQGYEELNGAAALIAGADISAADKLMRLGHGFIGFCGDNPLLFELMYDSELTRPELDPAIAKAQAAGFEAVRICVAESRPMLAGEELLAQIVAFWATLYGYASLISRGMLTSFVAGSAAEPVIREAVIRQAIAAVA